MSTSSSFATLIVLTACLPSVSANKLDLDPINTGTFSVYIILVAYTAYQAYRALGILNCPLPKDRKDDDDPFPTERVPYLKIFLATLTLVACYILETIWIPIDLAIDSPSASLHGTYYGINVADQLSDVLMAAGLLHFIDNRRKALCRKEDSGEPRTLWPLPPRLKNTVDNVMLSAMACVAISDLIVGTAGIQRASDPDHVFSVYINLYHVYVALYIVMTLNIAVSSFLLWKSIPAGVKESERISRAILTHIVPLLVVRALFKLCVDIVTSLSSSALNINYDAVGLLEAIVECLTYSAVLYMALSFARPTYHNEKAGEVE